MGRAFEVRKASMEKTGKQKSKLYSKYGKEIYVLAKQGADIESNPGLKRMIERAKKDQVPSDVIKRAIDKAKGGNDENYQAIRYEGFGVGGSMFIVECLTDNVNRTVSEVRNCFTKTDGKLGVSNSVLFNFSYKAYFELKNITEDALFEIMIEEDGNIDSIEEEDGILYLYADAKEYNNIKIILNKHNLEIIEDDIKWIPNEFVYINDEEDIKNVEKLLNMLEEVDDVQEVYHNIGK